MPIANVTLNNTYDEWRTITNQLITFVNDVDTQQILTLGPTLANTARDQANSATFLANAGIIQANTARVHANTAHESANAGLIQANTSRDHANAAFLQANTSRVHANTAHASANAGLLQANVARDHANAAFLAANSAVTDYSPAFNQANSAYSYANIVYVAANSGFIQANTARDHANAAFAAANSGLSSSQAFAQANTARDQANSAFAAANSATTNSANQAFVQANTARNQANSAFAAANAALSNTSGVSFAGNIQFPTGNIVIGEAAAQGIRLHVNASIGVANVLPQIRTAGGTQFINLNANTSVGGWNDLMLDRDLSIIYSKGTSDDGANLVIGPWTDSSFGYKQDGAGRHGFNTSNPRHVLDANGTANISGSLLVGAMNVVPTITAAFGVANTALPNTSGASFNGNLNFYTGRINVGSSIAVAPVRLQANAGTGAVAFRITGAPDGGLVTATSNNTQMRFYGHGAQRDLFAIGTDITFSDGSASFDIYDTAAGAGTRLRVDPTGNILIGRVTSTVGSGVKLDVAGAANASNLLVNGNMVFTAANDGAGSNLDADLLDGQQGSYYGIATDVTAANRVANAAFLHANAAFDKANTVTPSAVIATDSLNATRYLIVTDKTSGTLANANVSTTLTYNPSTGTLSSTLFNSTSDVNKKRDITIIDNPLEKVDQLNGVHFYWKDSGLPSAGLIAQDLIKVMPELVASDMSVTYSGVIGLLVEAIKELNDRIKKLENK